MEDSQVEVPDTDKSQDSRVVADYATTNWGETQVALEETLQSYFKVLAVLVPPLFLAVGIGYHLDNSEQPPVSILLPVSGGLSGFVVAVCLCIWDKVPEKESVARVLGCGILGSLIGLCFLGIDWTFEPAGSYTLLSAGLGFCASLPAIVSFGLAGGGQPSSQLGGGQDLVDRPGFLARLWNAQRFRRRQFLPSAGILRRSGPVCTDNWWTNRPTKAVGAY